MEKQNTDLVVYGTGGEIVSTKFQRMDFKVPTTILSYCDDVKNQISNIFILVNFPFWISNIDKTFSRV